MQKHSVTIKHLLGILSLTLLCGACTQPSNANKATPTSERVEMPTNSKTVYIPAEVIVKFKHPLSTPEVQNLIQPLGANVKSQLGNGPTFVIVLPQDISVESAIQTLQALDNVEWAEPNFEQTIRK